MRPEGVDIIRVRILEIRSDIYDNCTVSYSQDNGKTWSAEETYKVSERTPDGVIRTDYGLPVIDPVSGRLVVVYTRSLLPNDEMLEALTHSYLMYRVSNDGGKSWLIDEQIIQKQGDEHFSSVHPMTSVWVGKNAVHYSNQPFFASSGKVIVPVQITRLNPDGTIFCPPGAFSFHEMMVLSGTWRADGRMEWDVSRKIIQEPDRSTRGAIEGAVAEMPEGRLIMVLRGSNTGNRELPGRKWYCVSDDGGYTWSDIQPWRYSDGSDFYSPSSYSTILKHSNGRYYWFGNICPDNPEGNLPRYPLVAGMIDPENLLLVKKSLIEVDTRQPEETYPPMISNFSVYEERGTGDMILRATRLWIDEKKNFRGHAYLYRIEP